MPHTSPAPSTSLFPRAPPPPPWQCATSVITPLLTSLCPSISRFPGQACVDGDGRVEEGTSQIDANGCGGWRGGCVWWLEVCVCVGGGGLVCVGVRWLERWVRGGRGRQLRDALDARCLPVRPHTTLERYEETTHNGMSAAYNAGALWVPAACQFICMPHLHTC